MSEADQATPADSVSTDNQQDEKPHLSVSQLEKWIQCPRKWYFRYIERIKSLPGAALCIGSCFHSACEGNYKQKIETGKDLSESDMCDLFLEAWAAKKEEGMAPMSEAAEEDYKATGLRVVKCHLAKIAPSVHPKLVEQKFVLDLGDAFPFTLLGYIDLIEEDDTIVDNKAYKNKPYQSDVDGSVQFTAYSLAFRAIYQRIEPCCRMDAVTKQKTSQAVQLTTSRTNHDLRWFIRLLEEVATAIVAKMYYPCPGGWHCSERYCDYWDRCREMIS